MARWNLRLLRVYQRAVRCQDVLSAFDLLHDVKAGAKVLLMLLDVFPDFESEDGE
jgi:hypothetical protein